MVLSDDLRKNNAVKMFIKLDTNVPYVQVSTYSITALFRNLNVQVQLNCFAQEKRHI